jgi:hypothetical protein
LIAKIFLHGILAKSLCQDVFHPFVKEKPSRKTISDITRLQPEHKYKIPKYI